MEPVNTEQSIGRIRLTFPKRIFEVCHLMQRETEVQFLAEPGSNTLESNNHINVYKPNDEYISVSLTVGNLTFEANDLCLFVSQVVPKDPLLVENILKQSQSEAGQIQSLSNSISQSASKSQSSEVLNVLQTGGNDCGNEFCGHDESQNENQVKSNTNCSCKTSTTPTVSSVPIAENQDSKASHKKDAFTQTDGVNPKKFSQLDDLNQQLDLVLQKNSSAMTLDISSANILTRKPEDLDCSNIQTYCNTGLEGRVGSFQSECQAQDNELITPSGRRIRKPARFRSGASSADLEQTFPGTEQMGKSSTSQISSRDNPPTVADVHVVLEKRKRGRPRKPQTEHFPEEEECDKKPHAGRGKKRPNYKREANIECRLCHHMYKDELSLIAHLQKLHPKDPSIPDYIAELKERAKVQCKICGKTLGNKRNEMASHMLRVHGKDDDFVSKCEECGMEFRRSFLLKEHIRRQHPKHERILCHLCPASFKLKEYLTEHLKYTHNKQFKWQCDICHKMTSSPKNLRRHKRLHEGSQYRCHICGKMFGEAGNMKRHILHVHNSQHVPKRMCPHCNKEFTTKNNLIQHINSVHLKTTAFYCDICRKYFLRKKQLIEHAAIVHPGVPILSTKMDDDVTLANQVEATAMSTSNLSSDQGRQQTLSTLEEVEGADGPSTIILQTTDGSGHMIVTHQGLEDHNSSVSQLQQHMVDMKAAGSLHSAVNSIDMLDSGTPAEPTTTDASLSLVSQQPLTSTSVTEPGLSLVAQQALAAFEAGELDTSEFGPDHYLTVIGEDGQEIRVQILRKDTDGHQHTELMNMYTQESNVTLALSEHVQEESTSQNHNVAAAAGHQSRETTTVEGARGVVSEQEEANRVFIEGVQYVNNDLNQFMDPPTNDKHHEKSMETDNS